ncbi:SpoIIE family protein phosphatase [Isoptericola sp. 4D.3]|uniref:SpoIIE family protein phosphatase n=1 Tax=Isoptericola peretonis TaxID=2918523 RepID=A0ABT0J9D9_9MICO|nr:SpoIIE family protein phosphatase [Isoptericola sp. 4D.3]
MIRGTAPATVAGGGPTGVPGEETLDYRDLFDAMAVPKIVLDPDLVVLDANRSYTELLGMPVGTLVGQTLVDVLAMIPGGPPPVPHVMEAIGRCLRTGMPEVVEPTRWDLPDPRTGETGARYWMFLVLPVTHAGVGAVRAVVVRVEEVDAADVDGGTTPERMSWHSTVARMRAAAAAERDAAVTLQTSVLAPPPQVPGASVDVRYQPANRIARVGGDWYDVVLRESGQAVLVVGDVAGHDVDAAAAMTHLKGVVRTVAVEDEGGPAEVLDRAERAAAALRLDAFAAVTAAVVDPPAPDGTRRVTWARAGSLPPLVRRADGDADLLVERPGRLFGLLLPKARPESTLVLDPGDSLLLFTDGLVERRGELLSDSLEHLRQDVEQVVDLRLERLSDCVLARSTPIRGADDVALVALQVDGGAADEPRAVGTMTG